MRWLVDECVDAELVRQLSRRGHDVVYVAADGSGSTDPQVLRRAREEDRILLTEDRISVISSFVSGWLCRGWSFFAFLLRIERSKGKASRGD